MHAPTPPPVPPLPPTWRRVVVKIGTSSLTDEHGRLHRPSLWAIARGIETLCAAKRCQAVVVSSGAGAIGRERLSLSLPLTLPEKQAAAAVGQALLMLEWDRALAPRAVAQLLLSVSDVQDRERYVNAKHALEATLRLGVVPIVNENDSVATAELRVGDNDTLSAWTAYLVDADALVIVTDVAGLYDADPRRTPGARPVAVVHDVASIEGVQERPGTTRGTGGMATKLRAARIATRAGIETIVIGPGGASLEALAAGTVQGTRFLAAARTTARKAWIAEQPSRGSVDVDAGARAALARGTSLLPSGVLSVVGEFGFGDAVDVTSDGAVIARGLSNYPSDAMRRIRGLRTHQIESVLGAKDFDEVIHRDNLVRLERGDSMPPR
ncbi:MAG: glutamate 5-kinase [Trueperaceae bacterium]|nr:glutamate 5-kinase [Trueperaceae bacterium]